MLGRSNDSGKRLAKLADELAQTSNEMFNSIQEENDHIGQFATAITQMSATISEVSQSTTTAHDKVEQVHSECLQNIVTIESSEHKINQLACDVDNAAKNASELVTDVDKISTVMSEIQGIADQTNLLALNAAIEAARAGEQGRGFAVVADEVRALAHRTQESTAEIQSMIAEVQTGATRAAEAMQDGLTRTSETVTLADQSRHSLTEISSAITHIKDMITQIATAAEEQSYATDEINKNVVLAVEQAQLSRKTAMGSTSTADNLDHSSNHLRDMVNTFKVQRKSRH